MDRVSDYQDTQPAFLTRVFVWFDKAVCMLMGCNCHWAGRDVRRMDKW